jgi:hypothetical protein
MENFISCPYVAVLASQFQQQFMALTHARLFRLQLQRAVHRLTSLCGTAIELTSSESGSTLIYAADDCHYFDGNFIFMPLRCCFSISVSAAVHGIDARTPV